MPEIMEGVTLSKSREANEIQGRINKLVETVRTKTDMTQDEFDAAVKEVKTLRARQDFLADFTPAKEVARQGGDGDALERDANGDVRVNGMRRIDGTASATPGASHDTDDAGYFGQMKVLRGQIRKAFGSMTNYLESLRSKQGFDSTTPAQRDVLQKAQMLTRTIVGTAGDTSGAEFLLPLQQEPSIFMVDNEEFGLLQTARRYNVSGRTFRIPYVRQTDPTNARPLSGIANVTIIGEAGTKPILEPAFAQRLLTMFKYAAAAQIGDETIRDDFTGDLQPVVTALVGGQVLNAVNEHVTQSGTGVGMPLGALNTGNPSLLVTTRSGGANTATFSPADAFTMLSRHTAGPKSCWMVSRRTIIGIYSLALTSGTTGVGWVSFLSDLRGKPGTQMLGLPIVVTDLLNTWGTQGDINLVNADFMAVGLRQALTVESSIHVAFLQDVTTYRFFARGGGIPIPDGTYAYKATGGTEIDPHSPFVQLQ